jgi:hypothetical protein
MKHEKPRRSSFIIPGDWARLRPRRQNVRPILQWSSRRPRIERGETALTPPRNRLLDVVMHFAMEQRKRYNERKQRRRIARSAASEAVKTVVRK